MSRSSEIEVSPESRKKRNPGPVMKFRTRFVHLWVEAGATFAASCEKRASSARLDRGFVDTGFGMQYLAFERYDSH